MRFGFLGIAILILAGCTDQFTVSPTLVTADFTAYQDVNYSYTIPTTLSSPTAYALSNAPSWMSVDSATGVISGTPTKIGMVTGITFKISNADGTSESAGPYSLNVVGDTYKESQWHLNNTGQTAFAGRAGTAGNDIHLSSTIASGLAGKGVKIAISDTGIQEGHPGLKSAMLSSLSRNYMNSYNNTAGVASWLGNSSPSTADYENAHGTAVAGLAAEPGWKGFGARGVAPRAGLAGFLFIQAQETLFNAGNYFLGLYDQFAGDFDVYNYSWGDSQCQLTEYPVALQEKLAYGITSQRGGKGSIYVKAAGNDFSGGLKDCDSNASNSAFFLGNNNFSEDGNSPYFIVVGAVNAKGKSSSYSSPGASLWVSSPGGEYGYSTFTDSTSVALDPALVTTDFMGCGLGIKKAVSNTFNRGQNGSNCQYTATMNGTSGAAPVASGAIALMLEANPNLSWRDVKYILAKTADQVAPTSTNIAHPSASANLSGHTYEPGWTTNAESFHFHNWYGFGRINVDSAVAMAKSYTSTLGTFKQTNTVSAGTVTWNYDSTVNTTVTGGSAAGSTDTITVTENWKIEGVQIKVNALNCIGNLGIELTSPSLTKSVIMNINSYIIDTKIENHTFLTNMFYGETSQGVWTIKLIAAKAGCDTTFQDWQLNILGH